MAFSSYGNDQYGLNSDTYSLYTSANNDRWSTCLLVYFTCLLDHVIYLKLRREWLFFKAEQICEFAQLYITVILFSAWDESCDPGANWSKLEHM